MHSCDDGGGGGCIGPPVGEKWDRWDLEDPFGCAAGTDLRHGCCGSTWTEEEALCYAKANPDLVQYACVNNETSSAACDIDALRCHYEEKGMFERGRMKAFANSGCLPSASPSVGLESPSPAPTSSPTPTLTPSTTPSSPLALPTHPLGQQDREVTAGQQFDDGQSHGDQQQAGRQAQPAGEVAGASGRAKKRHFMIISRPHDGANWLKVRG